jgi:hypothetical protein
MTTTLGSRTESLSSLAGYRPEPLTQNDILRLRWLVRCMRCGAVPQETGETHDVKNTRGEPVTLPVVATRHAEGCGGLPRNGRPRKHRTVPAGPCTVCGEPMEATPGRKKLYCSSTCRTRASKMKAERS